jgi:CheY-like chemotaxis protein
VSVIESEKPDLILLDGMMADVDGPSSIWRTLHGDGR